MLIGGIRGLRHTISLVVAGIFVLLQNFEISKQKERLSEFFVGVMLTKKELAKVYSLRKTKILPEGSRQFGAGLFVCLAALMKVS